MAGMRKSRSTSAENTAAAQMRAMASRISLAGSTALMSVYPAPVNGLPPRVWLSNSYRSNQYATALSRMSVPTRDSNCTRAALLSTPLRPASRMPPNK